MDQGCTCSTQEAATTGVVTDMGGSDSAGRGGPNPATSMISAGFSGLTGAVPKLTEAWPPCVLHDLHRRVVTGAEATCSFTSADAMFPFTGADAVYTARAGACRKVSGFVFGLVNAFNSSATSPKKEVHCGRLTCRKNAPAVSKARRRRQSLELPHPRFLIIAAPCARPDMWARSSSASRRSVSPCHSRPSAQAPLKATGHF